MSCPAAGAGVVARPELPRAAQGQGSALQTGSCAATCAQKHSPCVMLRVRDRFIHEQHEFGQKPSIATMHEAEHPFAAIPAWLPAPGSPCPPGGLHSQPLAPGDAHPRAAPMLLARPPAAALSKRRPCCPPGPDSPSQSGCPNHPTEQQRVSPHTSWPCRDSELARGPRSQPHFTAACPSIPPAVAPCHAGGRSPGTGVGCWRWGMGLGSGAGAEVMHRPNMVLQELAHPDGEEAGAKQPSGKSQQDPTRLA